MIDLVQAQADLVGVLKAAPALAALNVIGYREKRLAQELDYAVILSTPRAPGGPVGAAAIVLMPTASAANQNVSGPVLDWTFGVVVQEMDAVNMASGGTQVTAEEWGQLVMDALHLEADEGLGTFRVVGQPMQPEREYVFPACIGYRVSVGLSAGRTVQTPRVPQVAKSAAGGSVTLTCPLAGAAIYYTLDGSFPSEAAGASLYTGPVPVASGQALRAAAYKAGYNKSATVYYAAP